MGNVKAVKDRAIEGRGNRCRNKNRLNVDLAERDLAGLELGEGGKM